MKNCFANRTVPAEGKVSFDGPFLPLLGEGMGEGALVIWKGPTYPRRREEIIKTEDLKMNNEELLCRCATNFQMIGEADTTILHSSLSIPPHSYKAAARSPFLPPAGEGGIRRSPARRMTEEGERDRLLTVESFAHPHACVHFRLQKLFFNIERKRRFHVVYSSVPNSSSEGGACPCPVCAKSGRRWSAL